MILTILTTKLHQPALPVKRVQRPHLLKKINEGLADGSQLTLISAPAGFGKTTCVCEWINTLELPSTWLSLDKSDDDPERFFTYLIAALQKIDETLGREVKGILQTGQLPPIDTLTAAITNDLLQTHGKFLLVLDDFQVIQDRTILEFIEKLLNYRPPTLHLVIITREDPSLPLARLRAYQQMTEIRVSDLRFSKDEVSDFLNNTMGLALVEQDIADLENRTEGWLVGLQLAGLSIRGREDPSNFVASFNGSHRHILSYLIEEVLSRQPEDIQAFLLQTSILTRLSGDLCDSVTQRTDSADLLEHLFNANLFLIPLDDEQHWYRYHQLFADLLRNQQSRLPNHATNELHRRASRWYEQAGMAPEAIEHALAAEDYPATVALLEKHVLEMILQGYGRTAERWLKKLPPEWHSLNPKANLAVAWLHLLLGDYASIPPYLNQVEASLTNANQNDEETTLLQAEWCAIQSNLFNVQGKATQSIELAHKALERIPAENFYLTCLAYLGLGGAYRVLGDYPNLSIAYQKTIQNGRAAGSLLPEMIAVSALTLMSIRQGRLRFAEETCLQATQQIDHLGITPPPITATVYGVLGIIYYEWNQLDRARQSFAYATHLNSLSGHNAGVVYSHLLTARLNLADGDLDGAALGTQEAAELLQLGVPAWLKPEVAAQQVRIYLAQGNPDAAEAVLENHGISPRQEEITIPDPLPHLRERLYLAYLRLKLFRGQEYNQPETLVKTADAAGQMIERTSKNQPTSITLQTLLLRALIFAALGQTRAALDDLSWALALAEPEGYIRTFVDEGPEMATLLTQVTQTGYVQELLKAFPVFTTKSGMLPLQEGLIELLTERELEVLQLIAEGLKYEEIATKLFITVNTVRFYVKEIYGKLGVNNRTRAIETGRRYHLLP